MRGKLRYTATHAERQEPMKSTREGNCFRLVSDALVQGSRKKNGKFSQRPCLSQKCQQGVNYQGERRQHWMFVCLCWRSRRRVQALIHTGVISEAKAGNRHGQRFLIALRRPTQESCTRRKGFARQGNQANQYKLHAHVVAHVRKRRATFPSGCRPDVPLQASDAARVAGDFPYSFRVSNER